MGKAQASTSWTPSEGVVALFAARRFPVAINAAIRESRPVEGTVAGYEQVFEIIQGLLDANKATTAFSPNEVKDGWVFVEKPGHNKDVAGDHMLGEVRA